MFDTHAKLGIEQFLQSVARSRSASLLLDYDGTLAPFTTNRERAHPYPGVTKLLQEIINTGHTRIALVTGRPAAEIGPLLGVVPRPEIWGAYGLQRLRPDGTCEMPSLGAHGEQALADTELWLNNLRLGHLVERKPASLAVHWRGSPSPDISRIRSRILTGWPSIANRASMSLREFDGGLEIHLVACSKGDAVCAFLTEVERDSPVAYLGDDQSDEDAFRVLKQRGLSILVRREWRETAADIWLRPPEELLEFFSCWLSATTNGAPRHR